MTTGGENGLPVWTPDGDRITYWSDYETILSKAVGADAADKLHHSPVFRSSRPRELFEDPYLSGSQIAAIATSYDVAPDGEHFLMIEGSEEEGGNQLNLVLNWFEELRRLAPVD